MIKENADIFMICWLVSGIGFTVAGMVLKSLLVNFIGLGFLILTLVVAFYYFTTIEEPKKASHSFSNVRSEI